MILLIKKSYRYNPRKIPLKVEILILFTEGNLYENVYKSFNDAVSLAVNKCE